MGKDKRPALGGQLLILLAGVFLILLPSINEWRQKAQASKKASTGMIILRSILAGRAWAKYFADM